MLDIEFIRTHRSQVEKKVSERGKDSGVVKKIISADDERRKILKEVEQLRAERNEVAKKWDIEAGKALKARLDGAEEKLSASHAKFEELALQVPNLALGDVPIGPPIRNVIIEQSGTPRKFSFEPKDHLTLGERLNIIDTQSAAKVSGSRFGYLKNEGALLELALVNMAMEQLVAKGFVPVIPPALIKGEITDKLGYWQAGGNENYYLVTDKEGEKTSELYLIGTAEHALVPLHWKDILPSEELPYRYAGFSSSFRREAGTYGKDTRGIFRVHQFEKVEMVSFVRPEDSEKEFEEMLEIPWGMMKDLGLPIRQVILSTEDMSFPAAKTVDIETWFPSQKDYRETHSISTTTDFQARRLETKYLDHGKTGYVHILNGTAFAIQRTIVAILENYQREDGSIEIPKVLRRYTGFNEISVN